ncbi:MAG: SufD family Fe-S cluster assembly protein [Candidatus Makana argininalis]
MDMVLLKNNIKLNFIKNINKIFIKNIKTRSNYSLEHFNIAKKIGINYIKEYKWKHFNLDLILKNNFYLVKSFEELNLLNIKNILNIDSCKIVFINGFLSYRLSNYNKNIWKIEVEKGLNRKKLPLYIKSDFFLHLIESLSEETIKINLKKNTKTVRPLYLIHINYGNKNSKIMNMINYRHHINIESNAKCQLIEHFISIGKKKYFTGSRTSIKVKKMSYLNYIKIFTEKNDTYHICNDDIIIHKYSKVKNNIYVLKSGFNKSQINVKIKGKKSKISIKSLSLIFNSNINEIITYIENKKSFCSIKQLHKLIVKNKSTGIFHGLIKIYKNAINSKSKMINNNLILDTLSKIFTQPNLEINTDNIKCQHGATIGKIDLNLIFYLQTRGLSFKDAKKTLILAFTNELIDTDFNKKLNNILLSKINNILMDVL